MPWLVLLWALGSLAMERKRNKQSRKRCETRAKPIGISIHADRPGFFYNSDFKYALTDEVGLADGCFVGPGVGEALGAFVGDELGAIVTGFLLGCPDVTVGILVGLGDGAAVVGTGVGPGDGAFVGLDVGTYK